jgi:6-pyruvoyltetrahydropterin/6-carboxytetrahydropterin synthase
VHVAKQFRFEASHQIDGHFGKCARLHGHSWVLTVYCEGQIDPTTGVVIDYYYIKQAMDLIIDDLDHHHLGAGSIQLLDDANRLISVYVGSDVPWIPYGFKPTSENILVLIADRIQDTLSALPWSFLTLNETCTSQATLSRQEYNRMRDIGSGLRASAVPLGKEIPHGEERHEKGSEEGKEVPTQEGLEETREDVERRHLEITDDDFPF